MNVPRLHSTTGSTTLKGCVSIPCIPVSSARPCHEDQTYFEEPSCYTATSSSERAVRNPCNDFCVTEANLDLIGLTALLGSGVDLLLYSHRDA